MDSKPIVVLIDPDPGVRNALRTILESANLIPEVFASPEQFWKACPADFRGCILVDLEPRDAGGLELHRQLRSRQINAPVILMTDSGSVQGAVEAITQGATDFLERPIEPRDLIAKVQAVLKRQDSIDNNETGRATIRALFAEVSPREREILRLLAEGKSSKQVAIELNISPSTVDNHRSHLLAKTGAENVANLIRLATLAAVI